MTWVVQPPPEIFSAADLSESSLFAPTPPPPPPHPPTPPPTHKTPTVSRRLCIPHWTDVGSYPTGQSLRFLQGFIPHFFPPLFF